MASIYSLLTSSRIVKKTYNEEDLQTAEFDTSKTASKEASKLIGEYQFKAFEGEDKNLYKPVTAEIVALTDSDGNDFNKVTITEADGCKYSLSIFGTEKKFIAPRPLTSEQVKKLVFGYCVSDGEVVTNNRLRNGKICKVRRDYCNIANI